jgi:RNA polymerase sigma-70 factor (ECF subfamily)
MIGPGFASVLERARAGDELAWSVLYDDLSGQLLGYLRGRGAPEPEDQVGETFLQIARDLPTFTGDEAGFRSWVFTIAHRRMLDASRSRRRRPVGLLPAERLAVVAEALETRATAEMEEVVARIADSELLTGLLAHLSEEQREVLLLRFGSDLDTATVGEVTGRSANAVAAITRRALARLREVIEAEGRQEGQHGRPGSVT